MNPCLRSAIVLTTVLLLGTGGGIVIGQTRALDPAFVAPHIFEVGFENDRVRVLRVTERNGETAPLHSHPERLIVYLSPCAWMVQTEDGEHMESFKLGDAVWSDRVTHGGETSSVVQECSRLDIELKPVYD